MEAEQANLRAALTRSLAAQDDAPAVLAAARLVASLVRFWEVMGFVREGRTWCAQILGTAVSLPAELRAAVLNGAGQFNAILGELDRAKASITAALAAYREAGDARGTAESLMFLGNITAQQGNPDDAARLLTDSLTHFRQADDAHGVARALLNLGILTERQEDHAGAEVLLTDSRAHFLAAGNQRGGAVALLNLGNVARAQRDYPRAVARYQESLATFQALGSTREISRCLHHLALTLNAAERPERAARFLGVESGLRDALRLPPIPDAVVAAVRSKLDMPTFAAAWDAGRALPLEAALTEAFAERLAA
jgi:tetratricopeptide (TPR) repeat protein